MGDYIKGHNANTTCRTHGQLRNARKFWFENLPGRRNIADVRLDRKIIIKWIFKNTVCRNGTMADFGNHGDGVQGSINAGNHWLEKYQLFKKYSTLWNYNMAVLWVVLRRAVR